MVQPQPQPAILRSEFIWDAAGAYLFDIDGTLLNSRDQVHTLAFSHAMRSVLAVEAGIDGLALHGRTEPGILREALQRVGVRDREIDAGMGALADSMSEYVRQNFHDLRPELCPAIPELMAHLESRGSLMGVASGNLETIGWLKLEKAGLRSMFAFGSYSYPLETRAEIFYHGIELARRQRGSKTAVHIFGDTPADVAAAKAVGAPVIAVATGIYSFAELLACEPDACLANASDLLPKTQQKLR